MKEIIDRACEVECITEADAKAVAALADLADQLQSRLEALEKDAARYRWLRDNCPYSHILVNVDSKTCGYDELDDAIDAAMKG